MTGSNDRPRFLTAILPFFICAAAAVVGFVVFGIIGLISYPFTGSMGPVVIAGGIGGGLFGIVAFFGAYISFILVPPVVMMENRGVLDSLRRSRALVKRSFMTSFGAMCIMFFIPVVIAGSISYVVNISAKAFDPKLSAATETAQKQGDKADDTQNATADASPPPPAPEEKKSRFGWNWGGGRNGAVQITNPEMDMQTRVKHTVLESINQILWLPMQILVFSFSAIIVALLYLKTRLSGGESMNDLIERFEDDGRPRKKWQERVRQRLIQSGRIPSKP